MMKLILGLCSIALITGILHACWFCKRKGFDSGKQPAIVRQQQKPPELHSFMQEVTNKQVAEADLKKEVKDVAETAAALLINEAASIVVNKVEGK